MSSVRTTLSVILVSIVCLVLPGCSTAPESKTNPEQNQTQEKSDASTERDRSNKTVNQDSDVRRKAEAGVGKRGQKLKDHNGPLATPAKALFRAEQQLIFMQVEQALRMHEIQFGYPKSHSEFMEKVIEPNRIALPELPAGQWYEYDTDTNQLMVVGEAMDDE